MKKRFTLIALATFLLLNSTVCFAQSSFSDLTEFHTWAEPQIEEMTTLGIIKGYTDGSFRPDQAITKTEALVLISRAAGFISENYDTFKMASSERYGDVVNKYNTPYPNEICYLLYKGVLTEDDLSGYISPDRASSPLLRYEMAVLLTKLMRAQSSLPENGEFELKYSDAGEIPFSAASHVSYVTNAALMQGVYDPEKPDEVFFKPYASVTRAQMAVLLHRVLDKTNTRVEYSSVIGKNASAGSVTYRDSSGTTVIYRLKDDVNLIVDGIPTRDISHVSTGASIAFFYIDNTLADLEIVNLPENKWNGIEKEKDPAVPSHPISGAITRIVMDENCSVTVNGTEYTLSSAATVYVNHVASTIYDLRVGYNADIRFANGKAVLVYAVNPSDVSKDARIADGVITKLNVTNRTLFLNVENSQTGLVSEKQLFLETGAVIVNAISGKEIDFMSLDIDDEISATGTLKDGNFYASKIIVR